MSETGTVRNLPHVWLKSSSDIYPVYQGLQSRNDVVGGLKGPSVSPRSTSSGWCL